MTLAKSGFVDVDGAASYVETWGGWVEDGAPSELIIFIPGNPGILGFYESYLERLHEPTEKTVWTIGHIGHEDPMDGSFTSNHLGNTEELCNKYDLQPQVSQKVNFLLKYTNPNTKVYLIAHSVGAWMAIEMLKNDKIKNRFQKTLLLFPTIHKMAESPNGKFLNSVVRKYYHQILLFCQLINMLPMFVRTLIASVYMFIQNIPLIYVKSALKIVTPSIVEKILFLAFNEMDTIKELDITTLTSTKDKLHIIHSNNDGWCPKADFDEIRDRIQGLEVRSVPYSHSFTLTTSQEFAFLTSEYFVDHT